MQHIEYTILYVPTMVKDTANAHPIYSVHTILYVPLIVRDTENAHSYNTLILLYYMSL